MTVWTTRPLGPGVEIACSPHLFRDCDVLVKRDARHRDPQVFEHEVVAFRVEVTRFNTWGSVDFAAGWTRYGVCQRCMRRAKFHAPDLLASAV